MAGSIGGWLAGHRRGAAALAVVVALAVGGVVLILGGGEGSARVALAQAAERTAEYPGGRVTIRGSMNTAAGVDGVEISGAGAYNSAERMRIVLSFSGVGGAAAQGGERSQLEQVGEVTDDGLAMYMRSDQFEELPGGASWMRLDFSADQIRGSGSMDPREMLATLEESSEVEEVGSERIRGVHTTHYSALIDQRDEVEHLRAEGKDEAADRLEQVIELNHGESTSTWEIWVGPDDTVHRVQMEVPFSMFGSSGATMRISMDFFDFGIDPRIAIPEDSEVFDANELAEQMLGQATG